LKSSGNRRFFSSPTKGISSVDPIRSCSRPRSSPGGSGGDWTRGLHRLFAGDDRPQVRRPFPSIPAVRNRAPASYMHSDLTQLRPTKFDFFWREFLYCARP
jgi:hypothetical protein